ncbi:hypothetical protein HPB47_015452 [Ixodes persulcatus]|uniref:Uncharacterized protein n=1 Tax=Ixodes persulcatus TaxID=34615 RepID=A0AC60QTJ2_IXOPE|nr:hypothetical protein HPB47_015452 [Ixodes persulcatus]
MKLFRILHDSFRTDQLTQIDDIVAIIAGLANLSKPPVGLNCACTELLTWMERVVGGGKAITSCSSRLLKMQHPAAEHLGSTQHQATAQTSKSGGDDLNHTHSGERWCSVRRCYVRGITLRPWPTVLDAVDDTPCRFLGLGLRSGQPSSELAVGVFVQACGLSFPRQRCAGWLSRAITTRVSLRNTPGIVVVKARWPGLAVSTGPDFEPH